MPIEPISLSRYPLDFEGFAHDFGRSFERYGFAVVSDLDLPATVIDRALSKTKAFFALPDAAKRRYRIAGGAGQRGYTPFGVETAKGAEHPDLKEFWHVGRDLAPDHAYRAALATNVWPEEVEGFREALSALYAGLDDLGARLLRAIARHLGLEDGYFEPTVRDGDSILRLLRYPPTTPGANGVRAGAHEDINVITLLLGAEEAGLQLLDRDGRWLAISPPPGSLVVNVGDMLQRLTNHRLPSTTHRVVNPSAERQGEARYSTPFFLHFAPDFRIRTLAATITPDRPDRYPEPITARDYLAQRLREIGLS